MAFPTVQTRNSGNNDTQDTSHVINLPTGIQAGDLLVINFGYAIIGNSVTDWAGFTAIPNGAIEQTLGSTEGIATAYKWATGSEGATVTITTSVSTRSHHETLRISGAENPATQAPEAAAVALGVQSPDPPSLTPTGGAKDYLWIACGSRSRNESLDDLTGTPTNYTNLTAAFTATTGANGTTGGTAERQLNAASEDPGAFSDGGSALGRAVAVTIAVHPASSASAAYTIVNGSDQQLVNVNAGGTDVDAFSYKDGVLLSATELAALLDGASFGHKDVAVFADLTGDVAAYQKKMLMEQAAYNLSG